jgi:tRNA A-37 threonylcarbamoyl transferase component Bud32
MDSTDKHQQLFYRSGLKDITDWLAHDLQLVDEPNFGHGGYSEVGAMRLDGKLFYVKRQRNYRMRTLRHPLTGEPSFRREHFNIQRLYEKGIETLAVAYYQELKTSRGWEVVLVTEALEQFTSLDKIQDPDYDDDSFIQLVRQLGRKVAQLHATGLRHPCLYPKHIFFADGNIRFIDLETVRPHFSLRHFWQKDLEVILRRSSARFKCYRKAFLLSYCHGDLKAANKLDVSITKRKK